MIDLSWPSNNCDFNEWFLHASDFVAMVNKHHGFWAWDFPLKYLSINLDTRSDSFTLRDRDGVEIHPNRVVLAILRRRVIA